ncbi:FAD-binding oxidoreductase [Brevundimonas diminuta]|jgi:FAD/FMN-containing dehydrogenase|uniref:FAD-binding oxidoreductase n=1 Tax=Brevundimonas diminuta TaxID=293 RepID=UPI001907EB77|nr:FAD-binding oxidoreductase [Brevundimonas diminuta]MBK1969502.1 FAD-binding oxidoreductase [Brevundimonas diminuta]MBK1975283.1 FAD-binding oxidoreductase [Brevundimonas diminuta]MDA0742405.1 FAD-binding oxidoreductase [Pseudomonadota bacterium]MDM8352106.1 FAD-binding oxidoreductase [Brevundimonas diminuta]
MTLPTPKSLAELKAALPGAWTQDAAEMAPWLTEWRGRWTGETPLLLQPRTTEEVARAVEICARHGVAVVTQGGGTGLVGGQIPYGEVLLSTRKLRTVRDVTPLDDAMTVEAGVTLLEAQELAKEKDRFFPLSLAAEGSATIGGVISTNAGGTAVLRYGMMRDLVLGIEAVMPDGQVFNGLKRLRKDNTGYDLKQMFIGAEGTLGVITAATLKLFPIMRSRATAIVGLESHHDAVELLARAKAETGGGVEAFELMKRLGLSLVLKNIPDTREPLESTPPWYVLIELTSGEPNGAEAAMERLLTAAFEEGLIVDAAIAQNDAQKAEFWRLREEHSAALKPEGGGWKHDVSVPVSRIADFIDEATAAVEKFHPGCRVSVFGHVGDGNLHYDVIPGVGEDVAAFIARWMEGSEVIHDVVARYDGSISAEHGLGRLKTDEARRYKTPLEIATMQAIRKAIDPQRIMNPAVLF